MEIEGYEIGGILSRGKAAVVYRARQTSLDRTVAIKIQEKGRARQPEARAAFETECRRLAGLLHPNLVSGLATGTVDGRPYLVFEHVEGRTLERYIRAERALGEEAGLRLGLQLARALACLEDEGLVHGDVAPSSILVTPDEQAKLARMTLVREAGWDGRDRHGRPAGTAGFMSPEQATEPGRVDARSNVYSLGAVLYFLLSRHSPVEDVTAEVVGGRVLERPPSLGSRRRDLGAPTLRMVARLMAPDPEDRPGSAAEIVEWLEARLADRDAKARIRVPKSAARKARAKRILQARSATRDAGRRKRRPR